MYVSLEFVFKREIIAEQKGDGSAMGVRGCTLPRWKHVCLVSLEQGMKREVVGANSSLIYRFVTHFWSVL